MHRYKRVGSIGWIGFVALISACGAPASPNPPPPPPTYSVTGSVTGAEGVSIRLSGAETRTVTTTASGSFAFAGVRPGSYAVAPTQAGFTFTPIETSLTITNTDVSAPPFVRQGAEEGLAQDANRLDALPESPVSLDEVILPNGQILSAYAAARGIVLPGSSSANAAQGVLWSALADALPPAAGPQQKKNDVVTQMVISAHDYACGRDPNPCTKWNFTADPSGTLKDPKPAQQGLTYVYGGKTPTVRTKPTDGCPQLTFGMDCSGLISRIAESAGLTAPEGSINQSDPQKWSVPAAWDLKVKRVTDNSIQTGDIVAWVDQSRRHVGIAASTGFGSEVVIISSTGAPGECDKNVGPPRGPRSLTLSQLGLGTPTAVLRLVTTLSGVWDLYIRCSDQSSDAAKIRFTINNDQGGPFSANGTGIDYDGSPLSFVLTGNYDQNSNTLTAVLSLADGSRRDGFTKVLLEDDTGFFPLTKILDNSGCDASARLVRVSSSGILLPPSRSQTRVRTGPPSGLFAPRRRPPT